jgi:hypothetical protein
MRPAPASAPPEARAALPMAVRVTTWLPRRSDRPHPQEAVECHRLEAKRRGTQREHAPGACFWVPRPPLSRQGRGAAGAGGHESSLRLRDDHDLKRQYRWLHASAAKSSGKSGSFRRWRSVHVPLGTRTDLHEGPRWQPPRRGRRPTCPTAMTTTIFLKEGGGTRGVTLLKDERQPDGEV